VAQFLWRLNQVNTLGAEILRSSAKRSPHLRDGIGNWQGANLNDRISLRKLLAPRDSGAGLAQTWMAGIALV